MKKKKYVNSDFLSSIFAIVLGLLLGFVVLLVSNPSQAMNGISVILTGSLTHGLGGIGQVFYFATPIICTGLSVGFAFKTGLFNIGATGQFTVGAFAAVYVGIICKSLGGVHWVVALLASAVAGALWGLVPGILKAFANVNEVISSIMMNYIGMYLVNFAVKNDASIYDKLKNQSASVAESANIPKMGLDHLFADSNVNAGFFVAIIAVIVIHIILNKTTFGFELKAVGFNRNASKYVGINEKRSIILSMVIAGALAGLAGGLLYLAGSGKHLEVVDVMAKEGFTGISVALLGLLSPIGIFLASIFIAYITQGGFYMQIYNFAPEVIDMIIAVIIYFSAFSLLFKAFIQRVREGKKREGGGQ